MTGITECGVCALESPRSLNIWQSFTVRYAPCDILGSISLCALYHTRVLVPSDQLNVAGFKFTAFDVAVTAAQNFWNAPFIGARFIITASLLCESSVPH